MADFTIPKPVKPQALKLLASLVAIGLAALFLAAYHAFIRVAPWYQALFAAALIEAGMIVESIALIRRNWLALPGAAVSLIVSGTYNYIQAEQAGRLSGVTDSWQLLTLAIGPLSALFFLALAYGQELRRYEEAVAAWELERQAWLDAQERKRQEAQERVEQLRTERALRLAQAETERELERIRLEIREQGRQERLQIRAAERSGKLPVGEGKDSELAGDWRNLPEEDRRLVANLPAREIVERYNVSERTARNWRRLAQPLLSENGRGVSAETSQPEDA